MRKSKIKFKGQAWPTKKLGEMSQIKVKNEMKLLYYYKYKEINFRLIDSLLNEISNLTQAFFKGVGVFELRYNKMNVEVHSLDEFYKEWEGMRKEMPEFFNFHIDFYKKSGIKEFNIYMFGSPSFIGFSVEGSPKQPANAIQNIFQRIFNVELEKSKVGKILQSKIPKTHIEFSMDNPIIWLIFSIICVIISYFIYRILK